ncbi:transcriptional regulator [Acetobacter orientalis]|uniref:Transcriptional regulator n=1 Tax=Acetobacter orientalis TaxID=146474 RepID=A0A2Z5ZEF0_9PROT|nr:transcriptional regulator [Acetobacter orientalis]
MLEQPALFTLQDVFALLNAGIAQAGAIMRLPASMACIKPRFQTGRIQTGT